MKEKPLVQELSNDETSVYKRYLQMFVGRETLWAFLYYEALNLFLSQIPGSIGYFLRQKFYRLMLANLGERSVIGKGVVFRCPGRISIGENVMLDDYAVLDAKGINSFISTGNTILVGRNTILSCNESIIRLGNFLSIGANCHIYSRSSIEIGSYVQIGVGTQLMAGSHKYQDPEVPTILQERVSKGIVIEDSVWLGNGSIILDGVKIGKNTIVGAGSVVSKDIPEYSMVLGNPARVVQKRK